MSYSEASKYRRNLPPEQNGYDSVQYLRAFAALFVLLGHSMSAITDLCSDSKCSFIRPQWATGSGVDLFFLISGFIMLVSSRDMFQKTDSWKNFISKRLIRIVPLYWLSTIIFIILAVFVRSDNIEFSYIASSFLFYPWSPHANAESASPVFSLGWTLNYEMMFYIIFSIFLYLQRTRAVLWIILTLLSMVTLGQFIPKDALPLYFWSRPIILEFAAGMLLAELAIRQRINLSDPVRFMLLIPLIFLLWNPFPELRLAKTPNELIRVFAWGGPMFCLLLAAVSGPIPLPRIFGGAFGRLGDSSYSLYLLHPFCIATTVILFGIIHKYFGITIYPVQMLVIAILLSCTIAIASYAFFEKPFGALLKGKIATKPNRPRIAGGHSV